MRIFSIAYLISATCGLAAQNLVPNPSFEQFTDCPFSFGQWAKVVDWISPYTESADYFNRCAGGDICSVPWNNFGYQEPSEGDAYMGFATFIHDGPYYREVIATQLNEPLQVGVPVYLSFKASPGGFGSWDGNSARWKAKGPGIQFFNELPEDWQAYLYPNSAALDMSAMLEDTAIWQTVSGVYVPDSAYTQLVITNFFEDSLSSPMPLDDIGIFDVAYAFVDQVCVSYDPAYCSAWNGIAPITSGWSISVQNPFNDWLDLYSTSPAVQGRGLRLVDTLGRTVWNGLWPNGVERWTIFLPDLAQGTFLLTSSVSGPELKPMKVVHVSP